MTTKDKLIEKLKEYNTYLIKALRLNNIMWDITIGPRANYELQISNIESELAKEPIVNPNQPIGSTTDFIIKQEPEVDINTPFFGNSGARPDKITDADIEAWAIEQSYTKNSWRYKALTEGAKAVLNNEIKHINK